jgi:hypothetical protein
MFAPTYVWHMLLHNLCHGKAIHSAQIFKQRLRMICHGRVDRIGSIAVATRRVGAHCKLPAIGGRRNQA